MSDDVFDAIGGDDTFVEDEEEQQPEGEGRNRTFIVAVAVLGGLLVCALISFGVWALVLNKPQQAEPPLTEIVALLDGRPDLRAINAGVLQKAAKPIEVKAQFPENREG